MAVTIAAGEVRIRHGLHQVAIHKQSDGRRLRIIDTAHLDGVAGRNGAVRRAEIAAPPTGSRARPIRSSLRPRLRIRQEGAAAVGVLMRPLFRLARSR
ncbi:hypothetical protein [Bradyrhizobium sp. USDA 4471]